MMELLLTLVAALVGWALGRVLAPALRLRLAHKGIGCPACAMVKFDPDNCDNPWHARNRPGASNTYERNPDHE